MYRIFALFFLVLSSWCFSQSVAAKLDASVKSLLSTSAAYSSNLSVYVSDENGNFVYEHDGNKGLSTASTQNISIPQRFHILAR